jgi:carboxy-cis,cis-muconate cyclase
VAVAYRQTRTASCGSYVSVFEDKVYSAGGPTGEVHAIDGATGGFGRKLQELLFVQSEELSSVDKSRKALVRGPDVV